MRDLRMVTALAASILDGLLIAVYLAPPALPFGGLGDMLVFWVIATFGGFLTLVTLAPQNHRP